MIKLNNSKLNLEPPGAEAQVPGHVLIVDDNEDLLVITRQVLESFTPFKIFTARNGHEALQALIDQSIDVIILDEYMPGMAGAEFFRIIRQRSIYVPVIFLTGKVDEISRQEKLALGAFDYLEKPIKASELILLVTEGIKVMERIRRLLERKY